MIDLMIFLLFFINPTAAFQGNMTIDNYTFTLTPYFTDKWLQNRSNLTGTTDEKGYILIKTNRPIKSIYRTCNHEILHNLIEIKNMTQEEELVNKIVSATHFNTCKTLIKKLNNL